MPGRLEVKGLHTRFDKRAEKLRIAARVLLGIMACTTAIPIFLALEHPAADEIIVVQDADSLADESGEAYKEECENDIEILVVFSDRSETKPFAGHNTTLEEWGEVPEWDIPQEYERAGGCLPESVRVYLYNLCREHNISYPLMLALIEKESGYQWDAESPDGSCKGYAMINDKWHQERMERLGVTDIYDPYGNLEVSLDYLSELFSRYHDANVVLMCYNCGESGAERLLKNGISSTEYSEKILAREAEISHEVYGD